MFLLFEQVRKQDAFRAVLFAHAPIDFEALGKTQNLILHAEDDADASLSVAMTFTINIVDVNEAPTIDNNGGGANATVQAAEGQTHVTDVRSSDVDGETEGNGLSYSLTGGADQAFFSIESCSASLSTPSQHERAFASTSASVSGFSGPPR